jgi:hypothetical protein
MTPPIYLHMIPELNFPVEGCDDCGGSTLMVDELTEDEDENAGIPHLHVPSALVLDAALRIAEEVFNADDVNDVPKEKIILAQVLENYLIHREILRRLVNASRATEAGEDDAGIEDFDAMICLAEDIISIGSLTTERRKHLPGRIQFDIRGTLREIADAINAQNAPDDLPTPTDIEA